MSEIKTDEYFGGCPHCGGSGGYLNIRKNHFGTCDLHMVYWPIGYNLFSSWQEETEDDWEKNQDLLNSYKQVAPIYPEKTESDDDPDRAAADFLRLVRGLAPSSDIPF